MAHNDDLQLFYSKSTAAADGETGHDHLGGKISADQPVSLIARPLIPLSGVLILKIQAKCAEGTGSLRYTFAGQLLEWQAPRDLVYGAPVAVGAGGNFELESATQDAWIRVDVDALQLPLANVTNAVILEHIQNVLFDDVTLVEAMQGTPNHRCLFLKNISLLPYVNVRASIELPAAYTDVQAQTFYPQSGGVRIKVNLPASWPNSYYIRNRRTKEIMYYASRGGGDGKELVVPTTGRRQRGTSAAEGVAGDIIELVAPIDVFVTPYNSGAAVIVDDTIPPPNVAFSYPSPFDAPQFQQKYDLASGEVLTCWLRRNVPQGAIEMAALPMIFGFQYDS